MWRRTGPNPSTAPAGPSWQASRKLPEPEILGAVSDELRRLADDLSTLSRAEGQRLDLHLADADLAELARLAAERLAPQFAGRQVTLAVPAAGPLPVRADPDRITQVLTNIIGNELTATPAGGTVTVQARVTGQRAEVSVTDTGTGLAAGDLERVFERFTALPASRAAPAARASDWPSPATSPGPTAARSPPPHPGPGGAPPSSSSSPSARTPASK